MNTFLNLSLGIVLNIIFTWFIGYPTVCVIYQQGLNIYQIGHSIITNNRIIIASESVIDKLQESFPEEELISKMAKNPDFVNDNIEHTFMEACEKGLIDQTHCENVENSLKSKADFIHNIKGYQTQLNKIQSKRNEMKTEIKKTEKKLEELYLKLSTEIWLISTHSVLLIVESLIIHDKGSKLIKYVFFYIAILPFLTYTKNAFEEIEQLEQNNTDNETILKFITQNYPESNGLQIARYHLVFLLYVIIDTLVQCSRKMYSRLNKTGKKYKKMPKREPADLSKLFQYCTEGDKEKLKELIRIHQHQININAIKNGNTALHIAVNNGHFSIVQVLITNFEHQIDASIRNDVGYNCLDLAVLKKNLQIFNLVLKCFKTPHISSLILAVESHQDQMIKSELSNVLKGEIKKELSIFCDLLQESKRKKSKQKDEEIIRKLEHKKFAILNHLSKCY